jgi:E3 ubiquitin-protein ligase NEDD4
LALHYESIDCTSICSIILKLFPLFWDSGIFELKPGGADIPVTNETKEEYIRLYFKYRVLDSIKDQLTALLKGVYSVVPREYLSVFDYQEMELLMCGIPSVDVDDWKRNTEYQGEYHASHVVVQWFWETIESFTEEDKARLLQFTTGSSCVPAQGFKVSAHGSFANNHCVRV